MQKQHKRPLPTPRHPVVETKPPALNKPALTSKRISHKQINNRQGRSPDLSKIPKHKQLQINLLELGTLMTECTDKYTQS